jgi:hypothetical protein
MAYMSQDNKKSLAPKIKEICKSFGIKATLAVRNHSTLILNVNSGKIDFGVDARVNPYCIQETFKDQPMAQEFLTKVRAAMYGPDYYDHSDAMTDYFDCSHYVEINIGRYNKPYKFTIS